MIIKLHGSVDEFDIRDREGKVQDRVIITEDDYLRFIAKPLILKDVLSYLLATKDFLFIGYGLKDTNFKIILDKIVIELNKFKKSCVVVQKEVSRKWKKWWGQKYGVTLIESDANTFMEDLLREYQKENLDDQLDSLGFFVREYPEKLLASLQQKILKGIITPRIREIESDHDRIPITEERLSLFNYPDAQRELSSRLLNASNDTLIALLLEILGKVSVRDIEVLKNLNSFINTQKQALEKIEEQLQGSPAGEGFNELNRDKTNIEEFIKQATAIIKKAG